MAFCSEGTELPVYYDSNETGTPSSNEKKTSVTPLNRRNLNNYYIGKIVEDIWMKRSRPDYGNRRRDLIAEIRECNAVRYEESGNTNNSNYTWFITHQNVGKRLLEDLNNEEDQ